MDLGTTYEFTLTGLTALMMHFDDVEGADEVRAYIQNHGNQTKKKASGFGSGDDRFPAWSWTTYVYHDGKHVAMPSFNLMACLRMAGMKIPLKGNQTLKQLTQTAIRPASEFFTLQTGDKLDKLVPIKPIQLLRESDAPFSAHKAAVAKMSFSLDVRRAGLKSGSKVVRVRPRFDNWRVSGRIEIVEQEMTDERLETLFEIAGGKIGLGEWRPGGKTPGVFGMFEAEVKQVK